MRIRMYLIPLVDRKNISPTRWIALRYGPTSDACSFYSVLRSRAFVDTQTCIRVLITSRLKTSCRHAVLRSVVGIVDQAGASS